MICPVCATHHTKEQGAEFCVQCGADLQVHYLLREIREEIQMKHEITTPEQGLPKKASTLAVIFQAVPSVTLLVCALFGIFVGMRFLNFIEQEESHRSTISSKWSEAGFEQLQKMNSTIKQELNLILDQRRENQALQAKVEELTAQILKERAALAPSATVASSPSPVVQEVIEQ